MNKSFCFILIAFFCSTSLADTSTYQCLFKNTLSMGASISGNIFINPLNFNLAKKVDLEIFELQNSPRSFHKYGYGPAEYLTLKHAQTYPTAYLVDYVGGFLGNPLRTGADYLFALQSGLFPDDADGSEVKRKIDGASAIVGIDLFYFSASSNDCRYYSNSHRKGLPGMIADFIEYTSLKNITLFLATVPVEDPKKVFYHRNGLGGLMNIPDLDSPDEVACAQEINHALLRNCKNEKKCFLTRLDVIVDQINKNGGFPIHPLKSDRSGTTDGLITKSQEEIRPDGLNISHEGSRILYESIERQLDYVRYKVPCP